MIARILLFCLYVLFMHSSAFSELPMTIVIPSFNNEKWCERNISSILNQKYRNYRILYVNDDSSDSTASAVEELLKEKGVDYRVIDFDPSATDIITTTKQFSDEVNSDPHFFTLINNKHRAGALANLYRMIHSCLDEEITVTVDGDDWLAHDGVLTLLDKTYRDNEIWMTHGTIKEYPWGHVAWSEAVPQHIIEQNAFRKFKCPGHLRTFYAWLFKKIELEDFLYEDNFFRMTWDMAIMYPLAEMAGDRHAFIKDVVYIYNMSNPINDNRVDAQLQNDLDVLIRKKTPYDRLPSRHELFDKVVIWGHKLHSHTHSYIHNAFYLAFQNLGYRTYWFDDQDDVGDFDFSHALFLTEGQVDKKIPLRSDCKYMLHNCTDAKYQSLERKNYFSFQVFTDSIFSVPNLEKVDSCIYRDLAGRCLYMPWATDLLPYEIDAIKTSIPSQIVVQQAAWVGTIGGGKFGNVDQLKPFIRACEENAIPFIAKQQMTREEHMQMLSSSYLAPAIVGQWQQEQGYIPCRIFKNISYGKMGITNSRHVWELFEKKIVYNPDTYQLFYDAQKKMETLTHKELFSLMDCVKTKHTYIQRGKLLLDFLHCVHENF
ncbi:MAG TPA: glycosyltransferase family A protein [Rhabdochlamydiaceae bacterium]|jgi:glycosyltransferase involved in cell wall biosynthesis